MTRGDTIVPEVTHRTNDGPALGLGTADATLADYERRGGLALLRDLPPLERIVSELKASGLDRLRRRGLPCRPQVGGGRRAARPARRRRQRRRGRAGDDQGPLRDGAPPAPPARGDADRHACARVRRGLDLHPRGVRDRSQHCCCEASTSSARQGCSTASGSNWSSAPARTSPARRRRCSSRWRAGGRCRASSLPSRPRSATSAGRP